MIVTTTAQRRKCAIAPAPRTHAAPRSSSRTSWPRTCSDPTGPSSTAASTWRDPHWGERAVRAGAHSAARCMPHLDRDLSGRASRARSGRHPLPAIAAARGARSAARHRCAACRWSPTTRATAPTPRACGGCCAGSGTRAWRCSNGGFAAWQRGRAAAERAAPRPARRAASASAPARRCRRSRQRSRRRWRAASCARRHRCWSMRAPPTASRARTRRIDPVAGHVPGARNHPFARQPRRATAASCAARAAAALERDAARHAGREPVVAMCGSGVTACHNLLALEVAGLPRRAAVRRLVERVDPRSGAPGRARSVTDRLRAPLLLARPNFDINAPSWPADPKTRPSNGSRRNHAPQPPPSPGGSRTRSSSTSVSAWGKGYFGVNARRPRGGAPRHAPSARDRPVRGGRGPEGARPDDAGGGALLRHPGAPPEAPARRLRAGDHRERLQEPLRRGVSHQGEPAAPGGRRGVPLRQGVRLRPRSRLQARAARASWR